MFSGFCAFRRPFFAWVYAFEMWSSCFFRNGHPTAGSILTGCFLFELESTFVAAEVSGMTGRPEGDSCRRSAAGTGSRFRGTCPLWKAPLWSQTGVAGAVKPSTQRKHSLNYSHLFTGASFNVKVASQLPFRSPFSFSDEGLLPAKVPPSLLSSAVVLPAVVL